MIKANPDKHKWALQVIVFLESIGISVLIVDDVAESAGGGPSPTFLPHVRIVEGGLHIKLKDVFPGDILHEAGHLAILAPEFRHLANDDLDEVNILMGDYLDKHGEKLGHSPEDPVCRTILQSGDTEATAWQYAAAQYIGLPDNLLFPKGSYEGDPESVLLALKSVSFLGIHGLAAAGWTLVRDSARSPNFGSKPVYPSLNFWLHPGAELPNCFSHGLIDGNISQGAHINSEGTRKRTPVW